MLEHKQTGMRGNNDLHVFREPQTRTPFPPTANDELLHLLEQPLALGRRQAAREWHLRLEKRAPKAWYRRVDRWPRAGTKEEPQQSGPADSEGSGEHAARHQGDQDLDQHSLSHSRNQLELPNEMRISCRRRLGSEPRGLTPQPATSPAPRPRRRPLGAGSKGACREPPHPAHLHGSEFRTGWS